MKMGKKIGIVLILISLGLLLVNFQITGAVVGTFLSDSLSIVTIVFFLVGLILLAREEISYSQQILDSRRYVDKRKEIIRIAKRDGYRLEEGGREGTRVYKGDELITVIPKHAVIAKRTSRNILEALATGESSFRRRG